MSEFLLDDQERHRFMDWLRRTIDSNKMLLGQLESMPQYEPITKNKRAETLACKVVLKMLSESESFSINQ